MKQTKQELRSAEVLQAVICNRCGERCEEPLEGCVPKQFEFATLTTNWGYGSKRDGEREESHLCENCYTEVVSGFKIPPTQLSKSLSEQAY